MNRNIITTSAFRRNGRSRRWNLWVYVPIKWHHLLEFGLCLVHRFSAYDGWNFNIEFTVFGFGFTLEKY